MVHLSDQGYICPGHRSNIEPLQRLQEVFLLYLCFDFGPDFVQRGIVSPVHWPLDFRETVLEDHNGENGLNDQVIRLDQVAELGVLLKGLRARLC